MMVWCPKRSQTDYEPKLRWCVNSHAMAHGFRLVAIGAMRGQGVSLGRVEWGKEKRNRVSIQFYGLGTMYVAPLRGRTKSYYQSMGLEPSSFMVQEPSSSILTHTHTSIHLSIQHDINHPKTLTYTYHHIVINPSMFLSHYIQGSKYIMLARKQGISRATT